jgi:hypothetical protein
MSSQSYDERRRQISTLAVPLPQRMGVGSDAEFGAASLQVLSTLRGLVRRTD